MSKKTDFTVDLTWWGSLRLAPIIRTLISPCYHSYSKNTTIPGIFDSVLLDILSYSRGIRRHSNLGGPQRLNRIDLYG